MSLTASELASMTATVTASLPDTAAIGRKASVADGAGGRTDTWPVAGADAAVACRLASAIRGNLRSAEDIEGARVTANSPWIVTLPAGTALKERDRLTIGARVLEVQVVMSPRSFEVGERVLCRLVQ